MEYFSGPFLFIEGPVDCAGEGTSVFIHDIIR